MTVRRLHELFVHRFPFLSWSGQRGERRDSIFTNGCCAWKGGTRFSSFYGNPSVSDRRQLGIPCWVRSSVPPRIPSPSLLPPNVLPSLRSSAFARPWPDKQLVRHVSTDSTAKPTLLPPGWNDTDIHYCYLRGKPLSEIQNIFWEFSLSNGTSHSLSPLGSVPQDRRSKNPSRRGWSGSSSIGKIVCGELLNELLRLVWIGQSSFA